MTGNRETAVRLLSFLAVIVPLTSAPSTSRACSTVLLRADGALLIGHNLDETTDFEGFVCVNKRDYYKIGTTWAGLRTYSKYPPYSFDWISKYGSVTWSGLGRDFPDAGINEAGLVIEEMSLAQHQYPPAGIRPRLFQMQWIQYHLDSFSTVEQVIESASLVVPDGWPWHFFVADKSGNCATLEYIDNRLVVHTGDTLPVSALCNDTYERELGRLRGYAGFGGNKTIDLTDKKIPRFVRAAHMLKNYDPEKHTSAVEYVFSILESLAGKYTRRSYVVDVTNQVVHFRTGSHPAVRHFSLRSFDYSCETPVRILDINTRNSGDVTDKFEDYTPEANRRIAESWVNHVIEMSPDGSEKDRVDAGLTAAHVERYARYAGLSLAMNEWQSPGNDYGLTALYWAAYQGDLEKVRGLLSGGADINTRTKLGMTVLMAAAQAGEADVVRHLIDEGAGVDLADRAGNTPLNAAIVFGHPGIAASLVQAGANVNRKNRAGLGPLHYSAANGDLALVKLLLNKGADMESRSKSGLTALMSTAFTDNLEAAKYLIAEGADPNAVDGFGSNSLLLALLRKCPDIAEELIRAGSDVTIRNNNGDTPWSVASANKYKSMMALLKEAGAKPDSPVLVLLFGAAVVTAVAALAYRAVSRKRLANGVSASSEPKHKRSLRNPARAVAVVLNVVQFTVGVAFIAARGLPTDFFEWFLLVMWFAVPAANLTALGWLRQKKGETVINHDRRTPGTSCATDS